MPNNILFSTSAYPYCGHPHGAIIDCGLDFFGEAIAGNAVKGGTINLDILEKVLTRGFKLDGNAYFLYGDTQAEGDFHKIGTNFKDDFYEDGESENLVVSFKDFNKYVVRVYGSFWGYWNKNRPFEFPAVAYTRNEMYAWFVWASRKILMPRLLPEYHGPFWEIAEYFVDVHEAENLMESKLSGVEPWAYGPAREKEPNFYLWHELTQEKYLNKMVSSYPRFTPDSIEWWKSQSWVDRYEFDVSAFLK